MSTPPPGYWPSPWPGEDAGPERRGAPHTVADTAGTTGTAGTATASVADGLRLAEGDRLVSTDRPLFASFMTVLRDPGEVYLQLNTVGPGDNHSWLERIHPESLEPLDRSPDLPGGPFWVGGAAAHANGSLYLVFGRWAHRLGPDCAPIASRELPREVPYNSFVILPDGHLVTKDFGGERVGAELPGPTTELCVLEPERLEIVARHTLPERSIARLSLHGDTISVVGDRSLFRLRWDGATATLVPASDPVTYRTMAGQTYAWDAVLDAGASWVLDNGSGTTAFDGTLEGKGDATAPLHLVRIPDDGTPPQYVEVDGRSGGIIVNPPAVDPERQIVVAFDSGHRTLAAFDFDRERINPNPRWRRDQSHAPHIVRFPATGELVTFDTRKDASGTVQERCVVLDIETGTELASVDTASALQTMAFPSPGWARDLYVPGFTALSRVSVEP